MNCHVILTKLCKKIIIRYKHVELQKLLLLSPSNKLYLFFLSMKNFDAAVGDIAILSRRYKHAEFTHPYSEAGLVMVVPTTKDTSNRALMFTKPFTATMWFAIAVINVYNGFVVWFIERNRYPGHEGSMFNQAGTMLCSSFTTLFSLHGNQQS